MIADWCKASAVLAVRTAVLMFLLALGVTVIPQSAGARTEPCTKVASAVERSICGSAALRVLDREMAAKYAHLRRAATPLAAKALVGQQRIWLVRRNRDCVGGDVSCLVKAYQNRLDEFRAIEGRLVNDAALDDVSIVILRGLWHVGVVIDPEGAGAPQDLDLAEALANENLPPRGATVLGRPGEICYAPTECKATGWSVSHLHDEIGGHRMANALHLDPKTTVFIGALRPRVSIFIILRPDNHLLANFSICGPNASGCRNGFQEWMPLESQSHFEIKPY